MDWLIGYGVLALIVTLINIGYSTWYFYLQSNAKLARNSAKFRFRDELFAGALVGVFWFPVACWCVWQGVKDGYAQAQENRRKREQEAVIKAIDDTLKKVSKAIKENNRAD